MRYLLVRNTIQAFATLCLLVWTGVVSADTPATSLEGLQFFERAIRPLLIDECVRCHGADKQESDLRLDSWLGMQQGGAAGAVVIPGKPDSSLLVTAVSYQDSSLQMPPDKRLSSEQVDSLRHWISLGAPHPDQQSTSPSASRSRIDPALARAHWAFQPLMQPPVPLAATIAPAAETDTDAATASSDGQPANPIDAFLWKDLQRRGLTPAPRADRYTLLRRATFDMLGLPPTPEEIAEFVGDESPAAWSRVINRLLLSPHYGERWGRHWLDVARYADSNGLDENIAHGNAWRYRDYVVAAFNSDKPYDQFVREQLAGDLLPDRGDDAIRREQLIATGFLLLGPKVLAEPDEAKMETDIVDEQVDTVGRAFLGMTLGCARCHDHKFDPFDQQDYYGLAGIFKSTHTMDSFTKIARWHENPIPTSAELAAQRGHEAAVTRLQEEITRRTDDAKHELACRLGDVGKLPEPLESHFSDSAKSDLAALKGQLDALHKSTPTLSSAMGTAEGKIVDMPIHVRGSHLTLGELVARRFPKLLDDGQNQGIPASASGRLELANWLTDERHPLTARVFVNRVWRWHFGKGLVDTPDNFGTQGSPPSHPELLDWLAGRFIEDGYSIKSLHRLILLSEAYQMSSAFDENNAATDPANTFYWRYPARRLEAEAIRDALLSVSGQLDPTLGGSLLNVANREFVFNHESKESVNYEFNRRSIYLPVIRNHLFPMFQLFDYNDASTLNGDRQISTVATQSLYLMNAPQVEIASRSLAENVLSYSRDEAERIRWLYLTLYGRPATEADLQRASTFIRETLASPNLGLHDAVDASGGLDLDAVAWQTLCHALFAANEFCFVR